MNAPHIDHTGTDHKGLPGPFIAYHILLSLNRTTFKGYITFNGRVFWQGNQEKELRKQCSPLCDHNTTLVPESQIAMCKLSSYIHVEIPIPAGFIDVYVIPTYKVLGHAIDLIISLCNKVCQESGSPPRLQYDVDY